MTAVQVSNGSLEINGGFFDLAPHLQGRCSPVFKNSLSTVLTPAPKNGTASVSIKGGTFVNFNPPQTPRVKIPLICCPPGYKVVSAAQKKRRHLVHRGSRVKILSLSPFGEWAGKERTVLCAFLPCRYAKFIKKRHLHIKTLSSNKKKEASAAMTVNGIHLLLAFGITAFALLIIKLAAYFVHFREMLCYIKRQIKHAGDDAAQGYACGKSGCAVINSLSDSFVCASNAGNGLQRSLRQRHAL